MSETFGRMVASRMRAHGNMTGVELARRLRKSASYVSQLINDEKKDTPPPEVMAGIERELGIPMLTQLRAWGYNLPPAAMPAFEDNRLELIAAEWDVLSDKEKDSMLDVIELSRLRRGLSMDDVIRVVGHGERRSVSSG